MISHPIRAYSVGGPINSVGPATKKAQGCSLNSIGSISFFLITDFGYV